MNIMKKIFMEFDNAGIKYAHFKSNKNLDISFAGKGDFDVIVEANKLIEVEKIIATNNGKRFNTERYKKYPGVDNWIVFDNETGVLYHLHLHYHLISGKEMVKDYVLPWQDLIFDTRVYNEKYCIFTTDPNLELVLLMVRLVIKSRWRSYLRAWLGIYKVPVSLKDERDDLVNIVIPDKVNYYISLLFNEKDEHYIRECILKPDFSGRDFLRFSKVMRRNLVYCRRMSGFKAGILSWVWKLGELRLKFSRRKMHHYEIEKKVAMSGGKIIAFVGVDGAGKSTISNEISSWLGKKIETERFYMGTGDGKLNGIACVLSKIKKKTVKQTEKEKLTNVTVEKPLSLIHQPKKYIRKMASALLVSSVQKNNYKKIVLMNQYRMNGGISILDRYPQLDLKGKNDGPKMEGYIEKIGNNFLLKRMLRNEQRYLSIVKDIKPDMVFKINISAKTSMKRKAENTDIDYFREKINDLNTIKFQGARIIDIDGEQEYGRELLQIKQLIWEAL